MDKTLQEIDHEYVANTYGRFPVEIVSGKGAIARDEAGKEYIDMGAGIGVTSFGYCDDVWKAAVIDQLGKVQHTSNLYYTEPCALLAQKLCRKTGLKKVFFGNSGAEANECAIKVARKYAAEKKGPDHSGGDGAGSLPRTVPAPDAGLPYGPRRGFRGIPQGL